VKFLCDRCKTRYSIGDDRVRGKILKIRCKNCANVITVREGMTDVEAAEPAPRRNQKPTTVAPPVTSAAPTNGALGAAFASALTTKPPAALEEEWYVSDDGEQEGPFSLTEAQAWVGAKSVSADLHCWSEGFDDWLPVDKVSHFRGLRKKPAPAPAPPPLPRSPASGGRIAARPVEEEPKPLFAATMAALEKSAPSSSAGLGLGLPPTPTRPSATPAGGMPAIQARTNGAPSAGFKTPAPIPGPVKVPAAIPRPGQLRAPSPRAQTTPGVGAKPPSFEGDQPTQIEAPPFEDEAMTAAEPVAAAAKRAVSDANDAFASAAARHIVRDPKEDKQTAPNAPAFPSAVSPIESDGDDDELSIGEVSRVVNLADLMASAPKQRSGPIPVTTRTGPMARMTVTGAVPRLGQTGLVPRIDDPNAPVGDAADVAPPPAVIAHHRRGLIMLIGVAALLLAGVVVAVVLLVFSGENITNSSLAGGGTIDTTRPDDPTRKVNPNDPTKVNPFFPPKQPVKRPTNQITTQNPTNGSNGKTEPELPSGSLRSDEIEDMARKFSMGTQRCYMRSQKGADAILIGDVKKIQATLDIGTDGVVKNVTLSAHAANNLGKCLIATIKTWKFRQSPGGLYKISLQFVAG
jgi:predicted Zn finger-like uncharacterized protein